MNIVLSTRGAQYACFDLKFFYLGTHMSRYKYIKIPIWSLSKQIMDEYKLHDLVRNGYVLCEICCGMYSLSQSGIIAYEQLLQVLSPFLYAPARHTPGLWRHMTLKITFSLCIDNFGIKYIGRQHVDHLLAALKTNMKPLPTGPAVPTLVSPSNGTTRNKPVTYRCLDTSKLPSIAPNIRF